MDTPSPPHKLHTFVSSIGPGGSPRRSRVVRVAVAGVDVLIVVLPRLRRPELEEEREGKVPGLRALNGNLCFAEFIWQGFRTWQACCGSSASAAAAARTRLVFWAGRRPPSVAANRGKKSYFFKLHFYQRQSGSEV